MYMDTCIHIYILAYTHVYIYTCIWVYACMHLRVCAYMCVHVCVCIFTCIMSIFTFKHAKIAGTGKEDTNYPCPVREVATVI